MGDAGAQGLKLRQLSVNAKSPHKADAKKDTFTRLETPSSWIARPVSSQSRGGTLKRWGI